MTPTAKLRTSQVTRHAFPPGEHLFHQGDPERGIHRVVSGTVTVYRVTADGHRQIEAFAGPGDYVSLCLSARSPTSAQALDHVVTEYTGRAVFERELLEDSGFRASVFREIDRAAADARRQATLLACRSAQERVADFVLFLEERFPPLDDGHTPIPMSRCDMADYLGLTLETVSRMLNRLKQREIIALPRPDRFRVSDPGRLHRAAGRDWAERARHERVAG